ncbi:MAG: molybdopterin oxidoreductase, partial [Syntrophobacteraceae bacterium]
MDRALIPDGLKRCPLPLFALWVMILVGVIGWGVWAGAVVLLKALNMTGLNDYFGFGAYITADLAIIALGAGAFFTG